MTGPGDGTSASGRVVVTAFELAEVIEEAAHRNGGATCLEGELLLVVKHLHQHPAGLVAVDIPLDILQLE